MSLLLLIVLVLAFMGIFWMAGQFLSGPFQKVVQFLCVAIIVIALVIFALGLAGAGPRIDLR